MSTNQIPLTKVMTRSQAKSLAENISLDKCEIRRVGNGQDDTWVVTAAMSSPNDVGTTLDGNALALKKTLAVISADNEKVIVGIGISLNEVITKKEAIEIIQNQYYEKSRLGGCWRLCTGRKDLFMEQFIINGTVGGNNVQKNSKNVDIYESAVTSDDQGTVICFNHLVYCQSSNVDEELEAINNALNDFVNRTGATVHQLDLTDAGKRSSIFYQRDAEVSLM